MKNIYFFILTVALSSCSLLPAKREVSGSAPGIKVVFFDPQSFESENVRMREFDLSSQTPEFRNAIEQLQNLSEKSDDKKQQFVEGSSLKKPYNTFDPTDKGLTAGARKILALLSEKEAAPEKSEMINYQISQLTSSIFQKYTSAAVDEYEILLLPITFARLSSHPKISVENNLKTTETPAAIAAEFVTPENVANYFSYRSVDFSADNCVYAKAKTGYGVHPGFQIKCGKDGFKVKFGNEVHSGPFNSRIYSGLGYRVPTINYIEDLQVRYDRRLFTEFNMRAIQQRNVKLAGQKVLQLEQRAHFSAFEKIKKFVLKDGTPISSEIAKAKLLKPGAAENNLSDADFVTDFESQIDAVILNPATLTWKDPGVVEVGPWRADALNYSRLREVRAMMVLSAWVGNFDVRKDNLAVYLENPKSENPVLRMGFSDAGSGLGKATFGLSRVTSSEPNDMLWEVSQTFSGNSGEASGPVRVELSGLMNLEVSKTFQNLNLSDAQWMLQKICEISKAGVEEALVASGMSSAEVVLVTEKLMSRRNKMLKDFEASKEIQDQCYTPTNSKISYDPVHDGLVQVRNAKGAVVAAPARGQRVEKGVVLSN